MWVDDRRRSRPRSWPRWPASGRPFRVDALRSLLKGIFAPPGKVALPAESNAPPCPRDSDRSEVVRAQEQSATATNPAHGSRMGVTMRIPRTTRENHEPRAQRIEQGIPGRCPPSVVTGLQEPGRIEAPT